MFARTLVGGQISMTVGLLGVAMSIILGSILGTVSGYYMGVADDIIQRIIEVISSFPTIPLWAALAAALPPISEEFYRRLHRYFLITVVLSLVGWTGLARQLRAKVMAYRSADFCQAAVAAGGSDCAHHLRPHDAQRRQPHHRLGCPGRSRYDPGRNRAELPRPGHSAPHGQLGRAAARFAAGVSDRAAPLDPDPGRARSSSPCCSSASWVTASAMQSIPIRSNPERQRETNEPTNGIETQQSKTDTILRINNLHTYFYTDIGVSKALNGVSLDIPARKVMGVVGESGCGKSVTALSCMRLLPKSAKIIKGDITLFRQLARPTGTGWSSMRSS